MTADAEAPLALPPRPLDRPPRQRLPAGTIDCHFHVFRDGAPLATPRNYTPAVATLDEWLALGAAVGIDGGVIVQPSVYGFDNSVLVGSLRAAPERLRGIAVVRPDLPDAELRALDRAGVRGVRCNTRNLGGMTLDDAKALAARVAPLGWVLQFQVRPEQLESIAVLAPGLGLPVIIDHLGLVAFGVAQREASLRKLRTLLDSGDAYVKISATYRLGVGPDDIRIAVSELARSHPDRLIWGTDWPHTELWDNVPSDADLVDDVTDWIPDEAIRRMILVDTPRTLFFRP